MLATRCHTNHTIPTRQTLLQLCQHTPERPRLPLPPPHNLLLPSPHRPHTVNLNPLPTFPTSHTPQILHTVPLNLGKYLTPSNGQATLASPA